MGKHTAGPWQVGNFKPNSVFTCEENGPVEIGTFKRKSDSALISAAPDLLQALEGAQKALRVAMPFMPADKEAHFVGEWLDAVNAAIARARGQA